MITKKQNESSVNRRDLLKSAGAAGLLAAFSEKIEAENVKPEKVENPESDYIDTLLSVLDEDERASFFEWGETGCHKGTLKGKAKFIGLSITGIAACCEKNHSFEGFMVAFGLSHI